MKSERAYVISVEEMVLSPRAPASTVSQPSVIFSPSLWYLPENHTYHIHESICQIIKHSDNQTIA